MPSSTRSVSFVLGVAKTKAQTYLVRVTPEGAEQLLKLNKKNRRPKRRVVQELTQVILDGKWQSRTNSAITLSPKPELLDGQNRLLAIVAAGQTVVTEIKTGVPAEAQNFMDTGAKRQFSDVLHISGYKLVTNIAAASQLRYSYELAAHAGNSYRAIGRKTQDYAEMLEYVEKHPGWEDAVNAAIAVYAATHKGIQPSAWSAFVSMARETQPERLAEFLELVTTGAGLEEGTGPYVLHRYAVNQAIRKTVRYEPSSKNLALIVKAYNAWLQNRPIRHLAIKPKEPVQLPI